MSNNNDAVHCRNPDCNHEGKMKVVQSGVFRAMTSVLVWRRKRCQFCGTIYKTVEVPVEQAQKLFKEPFKGMH